VVLLVFLLQAAQDRDRILYCRLINEDRLEAAGKCRILLDMLAVFIERGGANAIDAGERR
jgi:hypothetical protein